MIIVGVLNVLNGGDLEIKDEFSFDCPVIKSNYEWENLIDKFCKDSEKFIKAVLNMNKEELNKPFVGEKYGNYHRNIDVIIEHSYYHFGQIIFIKKLINNKVEITEI